MNKILIRTPNDLKKIILAFPFFYEINEFYKDCEIDIVAFEEFCFIFKFMPKKFKIYPISKDKRDFFGQHHFVVNLKEVFNIETYFDLEGNFLTAIMGLNFRAKLRVGVADNFLKRLIYNKTILRNEGETLDEHYLNYFKSVCGHEISDKKYSPRDVVEVVEKMTQLSEEVIESYLVVIIDYANFKNSRDFFKNFFTSIDLVNLNISFVNVNGLVQEENTLEIENIKEEIQSWKAKAKILFFNMEDISNVVKKLVFTKGVLTDCSWIGPLCSYYGVESMLLNSDNIRNKKFLQNVKCFELLKDSAGINTGIKIYLEEEIKEFNEIQSFIDFIHASWSF